MEQLHTINKLSDSKVVIMDCPSDKVNCSIIANNTVELDIGHIPTYFSITSCTLSVLGSLLIFFSYCVLKEIRNVAQKIITLLAIADFFTAFGYLLADWNYLGNSNSCTIFKVVCEAQSFITSWSSICSFGWTCALALHFYLLLSMKKRISLQRLLILENVIIWIFPLLIIVPLLALRKLGYSPYATSNWCFIRSTNHSQHIDRSVDGREIGLILVGGKLWEILSYVFVLVMYTLTRCRFQKHIKVRVEQQPILRVQGARGDDEHQTTPQEETRLGVQHRLLLIPIMFIVLRMWGTIQFFFSLVATGHGKCVSNSVNTVFIFLGVLQAIGDGGQGWSNALLYILLSPTIRKQLLLYPVVQFLLCIMKKLRLAQNINATGTAHEGEDVVPVGDRRATSHVGAHKKEIVLSDTTTMNMYEPLMDSGVEEVPRKNPQKT